MPDTSLPTVIAQPEGVTTTIPRNDFGEMTQATQGGSGVSATRTYRYVTAAASRGMGYDDLDRLSTATGLWGSGSYSYDALGNIETRTEGGQTMTYHYDTSNRLASITGASPMPYGTQDFSYNRAGNLVSSTNPSITYRYDGHKRRVQQTQGGQTEYTMYSQSGTLLHKKVGGVTTDYIYAGQMLIARDNSSTGLHYLHTDLLGSPIEGEVGSTSYSEDYTPWGEKQGDPIQLADDVGYTGHQSDTATGLTYMQARYYDPVVGRFLSVDPVGFTLDNPMSFNRYSYVNNNPLLYTDPSGETAIAVPPQAVAACTGPQAAACGAVAVVAATASPQGQKVVDKIEMSAVAVAVDALVDASKLLGAMGVNNESSTDTETNDGDDNDGGDRESSDDEPKARELGKRMTGSDSSLDQLEGIEHKQRVKRKGGQGEEVHSIEKSKQRTKYDLNRIDPNDLSDWEN